MIKRVQMIDILFILSAIILTALVYGRALDNPLFFDSTALIQNPITEVSFASIKQPRWLSQLSFIHANFTNTTTIAIHQAFNLVLHTFNVILLYLFSQQFIILFAETKHNSKTKIMCAAASLLYLISATQTYAVGYLVQRSILMAVFFFLLAMTVFLQSSPKHNPFKLSLVLLLFYAAMASKEHVAVLAPFFLVIELHRCKRMNIKFLSLKNKAMPVFFVFLSIVTCFTIFNHQDIAFRAYEAHAKPYLEVLTTGHSAASLILLNFINQATLFFRYVYLFLFPITSAMSIDFHLHFPTSVVEWPDLFFALLFAGLPCILFFFYKHKPAKFEVVWLAVIGLYLAFSTELSVVRLIESFVIYRSYLWMIFLVPILAVLFHSLPKKIALPCISLLLLWQIQGSINRLQTFESLDAVWDDAIQKLDHSAPGAYRSLNSYGMSIASKGDFQKALPYIEESIARNPHYPLSYYNKAYCHQSLEQYEKAIQSYKTAISLDPNYADAYNNLGIIYIQLNRTELALTTLLSADQIKSNNVKTKNNLGALYDRLGQTEKAIQYYEQALNIDNNDPLTLNNLGLAQLKSNNAEKAMVTLKQALELKPDLTEAKINLGLACQKANQLSCAQQQFQEILNDQENNTKVLFFLANIQSLQKNYSAAKMNYQKLLQLEPKNIDAHYNLGILYMNTKEISLALEQFKKCHDLDPEDQNCIQAMTVLTNQPHPL